MMKRVCAVELREEMSASTVEFSEKTGIFFNGFVSSIQTCTLFRRKEALERYCLEYPQYILVIRLTVFFAAVFSYPE